MDAEAECSDDSIGGSSDESIGSLKDFLTDAEDEHPYHHGPVDDVPMSNKGNPEGDIIVKEDTTNVSTLLYPADTSSKEGTPKSKVYPADTPKKIYITQEPNTEEGGKGCKETPSEQRVKRESSPLPKNKRPICYAHLPGNVHR